MYFFTYIICGNLSLHQVKLSLDQLPSADLYLIEEQSHRSPSNRGFLEISVRLRTLEAMVHAILNQRDAGSCVRSIPALQVGSYFEISGQSGKSKTLLKKKAAINLITELITPGSSCCTPMGIQADVPELLVNYFNSQKKKDDLSDCLLQALALLDWKTMILQLENYKL